ncbi:ABC transporter permease [Brevibacillus nitrificans]|uniref:ABC transporter permease n=1 Tax=Brevibacillus nitrificans TaxID=651560 RepID=UPI00285E30F2|nr:ABC transporter permease [Brevibacillus nitrificans]MDR7316394.1 simple sugar transport system permease protein [Brevibacillus nitrificans]
MTNPNGNSPEPITPISRSSFSLQRYLPQDASMTRLFIIMLVVFVLMAGISPDTFLSLDSFTSMSFQFPVFGIFAFAMMLSMISGGIDLSIVGIANLTSIIAASVMVRMLPAEATASESLLFILLGVAAALIVGLVCGLFNGFAITKIGIPPILVTLGTMQLFMGIAIILTKGQAIVGLPELYTKIGNGSLWIFPVPLLMFCLCILGTYVLLNKRSYGLKLQMLGANPTASVFSGVNNTRVLLKTYAISGMLASIAGLVIVAQTNSAKADYGTSYILQAILVAVMGGVDPRGGFGKVAGIVMAVLTLQFLSSGLNALHVGNFFKDFMWGIVLLLVMVINEWSNRRKARRIS